ncbi:probable serine/threonine-protein kinase DDB_G0282963 [Chrysoperla carnea]|uniref:probable serine/threonine-protein kinase DDB_G0282963 n=1 Tax=Chrysoperla carnea TaxID=189513 RepID=UPI001D07A004|nr:probable serine/threonine-protein kinase DDB_G0282963 [Chrysoperla carnea]
MNSNKMLILQAPSLYNSSCSHPRYSSNNIFVTITLGDIIQFIIIVVLTFGILFANLLLIIVINSQRYIKYIHSQPRYLLTSLASIDFAIGLLITPLSIIPTIKHCWPFGELICQVQALLRVALAQQSAVILICMAIDRYVCMLYPVYYHKHSTKKGCFAIISITGIINVILFAFIIVFIGDNSVTSPTPISSYTGGSSSHSSSKQHVSQQIVGYYFNKTGSLSCEPYYYKSSYRILIACCFYFPTTMILMYCYGSAFHVNKLRLKKYTIQSSNSNNINNSNRYLNNSVNFVNISSGGGRSGGDGRSGSLHDDQSHNITISTASHDCNDSSIGNGRVSIEKLITSHERRLSTSASRTMAAMSLGFIVLVTPYSIQEVVAACTGQRAPEILDFIATWLQLSNAFWNPFLYWLLNNHFRRISKNLLYTHVLCRRKKTNPDVTTIKSSYNTASNSYNSSDDSYNNDRTNQLCQITTTAPSLNNTNTTTTLNITGDNGACAAIHSNLSAEQYWGEILERTLSSNSLQQLQKSINNSSNYYHQNTTTDNDNNGTDNDEDATDNEDDATDNEYNNLSSYSSSNVNNHDSNPNHYHVHHHGAGGATGGGGSSGGAHYHTHHQPQYHSSKCMNYHHNNNGGERSEQFLSIPDL